jgi:hypothetical protein
MARSEITSLSQDPVTLVALHIASVSIPTPGVRTDVRRGSTLGTHPGGLGVDLLLLVGEESLADEIGRVPPEDQPFPVGVAFVPPTAEQLLNVVTEFRPDVIHFFCHASPVGGPHVEIARWSDREEAEVGQAEDSLHLEARDIRMLSGAGPPPLIVLNCAPSDLLAQQLVRDHGVSATIGMREGWTAGDAATFTDAFYRRLLADLARRADGAPDEPLDVARFVVAARVRLAEQHAGAVSTRPAAASTVGWTLPIVYTRTEPLHITSAATVYGANIRRMPCDLRLGDRVRRRVSTR